MFWLLLTAIRQHQFAAPLGVIAMAIIFSLRPIIGDLQHANVNIFVAVWCGLTLAFYLKRRDIAAGVCLSLAIVTKITPALLLVYFAYKRSWRLCATATGGLVLLFLVLPGMLLGFGENLRLLGNWFDMLIAPFAFKGFAAVESANQSVYGVAVRLAEMIGFPPVERMPLQDAMSAGMEEMARPAGVWRFILRGAISLPILATAAWLCRSRDASRRDPRVLLEFALILIAMLLLSERTWKHHATTLPIVYLTLWYVVTCLNWSDRQRAWLAGGLFAQLALLNFTTSGIFGDRGAEALLRVGAFTWGLLICFVQTGWMLRRYTIHLNMRPHESRAACSIAET
jgi:hypothetical protein